MATSVYVSLLLNDLRRKKGDLLMVKREIKDLARKALDLEQHIAALAAIITAREAAFELEAVKPIRTKPRVCDMKHGRLTRNIMACMKEAGGVQVTRLEIFAYVVDSMDAEPSREDQAVLRIAIKDCMKNLVRKGWLLRHHPTMTNAHGAWSLPTSTTPPSTRVVPGRAASNP